MAENKKGFILYADLLQTFSYLNLEQRGQVITWVLEYVNDQNPEPLEGLLMAVVEPIKQQLKRDLKKFEKRVESNRQNGAKGGRPKKTQPNPTKPKKSDGFISKPKKPDTDNDIDIDSDIDNDIVIDTDIKKQTNKLVFAFDSKDFLQAWDLWVSYRKEINKRIRGLKSAQGQQNKLAKLSGGDPTKAVNIIMQSIENNWVGLFDLKNETNEQQTNTPDELKAVVNRLVERHNARNGA
jgi:hypothetical protein